MGKDKIVSLVLPGTATNIGYGAFLCCTALQSVSLPAATSIGWEAFKGCTALQSVNLPAVTNIDENAFEDTGTRALTVILPRAAPTVAAEGDESQSSFTKSVAIKTPAGRTGYDDAWRDNFKKAFGVSSGANTVDITLSFEEL
jgi:hypothetical protein